MNESKIIKNRTVKIISISGLDGSGKSTQVELIKKHLERRKKKVYYFHAVHFSIINKIIRILKSPLTFFGIIKKTEEGKPKSVTDAKEWQIKLRRFVLEIDMGRFEALIRNLEDCNYDYIVSDRYFYDNIINIEYLSAKLDPDFHEKDLLGLKKFLVEPDVKIYLRTDPKEIMRRAETPDQGIVYLELKNKLYDQATKVIEWSIVDGNRTKEIIYEEIKEIIKKELKLS
ncbi:MAG: hypothetical protein OEV93_04675 [Candidatus Moranbacteria bacterium]|nr:hypothetical protein [Candidatus Moranbacteria bacterium]